MDVACADGSIQRLGIAQAELVDQIGQGQVASAEALELALEDLAAFDAVLLLVALAEEAANLGPTARGGEEAVVRDSASRGWAALFAGDDLDDFPVLQLDNRAAPCGR